MNTPLVPLFPLNLLPLPGETVALHIFEERYQALFHRLEAMELDEFGIPFVDGDCLTGLGGLMRLVFASEPDENGFRDAAVQCVGLFKLASHVHLPEPGDFPPYPSGDIARWSDWKNFELTENAATDFSKAEQLRKTPETEKSLCKPSNGLIQKLIRHQIAPKKRFEILNAPDVQRRNEQINNAARFSFLIAEQEAQRNKGYFPN